MALLPRGGVRSLSSFFSLRVRSLHISTIKLSPSSIVGGSEGSLVLPEDHESIQWSNPRADLDKVPDEILYALPPPLKPYFPETDEEARRRRFWSWAPGMAFVVVAGIWYTRAKLKRDWRGGLQRTFPALVGPLLSTGILPRVEASESFDRQRLYSRLYLSLSRQGGGVTSDVLQAAITSLGGDSAALSTGTAPIDIETFVTLLDAATTNLPSPQIYFAVEEQYNVVGLSPDVEDQLAKLYATLVDERGGAAFTADDLCMLCDHLGTSIDLDTGVKFLATTENAPDHALEDPRRLADGVSLALHEFLQFFADQLYGKSDEAILRHLRVYYMLRNA